jgi:hypothetical protein
VFMRFSVLLVKRAMLVTSIFLVAALAAAPRSGAAIGAGKGLPLTTPTTDPTVCPSYTSAELSYCYEIVAYTSGSNYVTGINDFGVIDGAYSSGSVYGGFAATPSQTPDTTLNPYTTFTGESDGTRNTYLDGLNNGTGKNVNSEFMAGYAAGSGGHAQGVVLRGGGGWTGLISDPAQQSSGQCAVTEVLAINDSRMGVGFYDTGSASPCTQHAFEFYSNVGLTTPYTFVDLTPTDPFGCSPSATSSVATGISTLGDVVGYVSCTTGSSPLTAAWFYRQLEYSTFCYTPNVTAVSCNANSRSTYADGINFSDDVVGYYTDGSGNQHGYMINPTTSGATLVHVEIPSYDNTVLWSIMEATESTSQNTYWTGWVYNNNGNAKGIVGMCNLPRHCL